MAGQHNTYTGITGAGILVYSDGSDGASASATIVGETISDPTYGIEINGGSATVSNSTIENNTTGVYVTSDGSVTLTGNTITDNVTGVKIDGGSTLVSATGNDITNNTGYGVDLENGAILTGAISDNDLAGNTLGALYNADPGVKIDASLNYWGSNTTEAGVQDQIALAGGSLLSDVDYTPWFSHGDTNAGTVGFQDDRSALNVGAGGGQTQFSGSQRINEAIADLNPDGTIYVHGTRAVGGGIFNEDVDVSKKLTLLSTEGTATIAGDSGTAHDEPRCTGAHSQRGR